MERTIVRTPTGIPVTTVTADEMRTVDRVAVNGVGLALLQMMENAGRTLAQIVASRDDEPVVEVAGGGGNGGGGLACARHLDNQGISVRVLLDRPPATLDGATAKQYRILQAMAVPVTGPDTDPAVLEGAAVLVDALIGYGSEGPVRGRATTDIEDMNDHAKTIISLDVPAGLNASTGERPGVTVS